MRYRPMIAAALLALGSMAAVACAPAPPPGRVVVVDRAPPPEHRENWGPAPHPGYVWVNGYWGWGGEDFHWVPGYWTVPPRSYRAYVPAKWEKHHGSWYLRPGHWR